MIHLIIILGWLVFNAYSGFTCIVLIVAVGLCNENKSK